MSTLLFCTSYGANKVEWRLRYLRWVERARRSGLLFDRLAIIDDGSPLLPGWAKVIPPLRPLEGEGRRWAAPGREAEVELHHFPENLGRRGVLDFPGWYRSFAYSAVLARQMRADKIIHIESDAALLSTESVEYVNRFVEGWMAPYSAMYGFPEMAIQVVAGASVAKYIELFSRPYDWLHNRIHETALPYTHVVRPLVGDRYTGLTPVPRDADFVSQIPSEREDGFFWWDYGLGTSTPSCASDSGHAELFRLEFTAGGNAAERCGFGWAAPEAQFRWTVGQDSHVSLPPGVPATALVLDVEPCVEGRLVPFQKVEVHLDGRRIARFKLGQRTRVRIELPPGGTGAGVMRLHHPDAVVVRKLAPQLDDDREVAICVFALAGVATQPDAAATC